MASPPPRLLPRSGPTSSAALEASEWVGATLEERAAALRDLLELADALPPNHERLPDGPPFPAKLIAVHRALERASLAHASGGAIALAYYAVPRVTTDIDLNVFVPPSDFPRIQRALAPLEVEMDADLMSIRREGRVALRWDHTRLDVYFAVADLHMQMRRRLRRLPFLGAQLPVVAPEHIVVWKVLMGRPKDWLDVEQVLAGTQPLDLGEIERWLATMAETDRPLAELRKMATEFRRDGR